MSDGDTFPTGGAWSDEHDTDTTMTDTNTDGTDGTDDEPTINGTPLSEEWPVEGTAYQVRWRDSDGEPDTTVLLADEAVHDAGGVRFVRDGGIRRAVGPTALIDYERLSDETYRRKIRQHKRRAELLQPIADVFSGFGGSGDD